MTVKRHGNGVTIREVYDLLAQMDVSRKEERAELLAFIKQLKDDTERAQAEMRERIEKHDLEIYGEGETRGIKSRMGLAEDSLRTIGDSARWDRYKQFATTLIASSVAAIAGAWSHK